MLNRPRDCIHIGDRESDIYELFAIAQTLDTKFLVRTCVDRLAQDGKQTVATTMQGAAVKGFHEIEVRDQDGKIEKVPLRIKYELLCVRPPLGKKDSCPELILTVIHATEISRPRRRKRIEWKLITNLPVNSLEQALEKIGWYAMRWKIETFHKILKSGCRAEQSKLRTTERLTKLIAVFCILSWRVFWMTMIGRVHSAEPAEIAFTTMEIELLQKLIGLAPEQASADRSLDHYLMKVARLGGYLARASDPPPGTKVIWRGLSRLTDVHLGYLLAKGVVGN